MMQSRFVQVAIWVTVVAVAYVGLLVGEQSSMIPYDAWRSSISFDGLKFAVFLGIGVLDVAYSMVGRAVMARRVTSGLAGRAAFLVASGYLPMWVLTTIAMYATTMVVLFVNYAWILHVPASTIIVACLLAPPVLRSQHWGAARFRRDGISVSWDDGLVTKLKWSALPDLGFLQGKSSSAYDMPPFPRCREFHLVGAARQRGMEVARRRWATAHARMTDRGGSAGS